MKFLIMHGSFGSPDANWFRWLEKQLQALGHEVILEQFPSDSWDALNKLGKENRDQFKPVQSLTSWDAFFKVHVLPKIGKEPFVFVGHSIAPVFFLHMAEKYDLYPTLAIFVSPFLDLPDSDDIWQFYPVNKTFYKTDFNFPELEKYISRSFVVYGDNDPYVPIEKPLEFAQKLNSTAIAVKGGGHLSSTFKEFPLLLELIKQSL